MTRRISLGIARIPIEERDDDDDDDGGLNSLRIVRSILIPINQRTADESRGKRQAKLGALGGLEKKELKDGTGRRHSWLGLGEERDVHPPHEEWKIEICSISSIDRGVVFDV
ncbi:hypothetical protein QLX08_004743 [Tetragonisca angustula]|uniref:Uncharacterized protein n=1 Tax=Tetragonisca angustula TaxID=166442 RepID=A0AAW1A0U0_9HYME